MRVPTGGRAARHLEPQAADDGLGAGLHLCRVASCTPGPGKSALPLQQETAGARPRAQSCPAVQDLEMGVGLNQGEESGAACSLKWGEQ